MKSVVICKENSKWFAGDDSGIVTVPFGYTPIGMYWSECPNEKDLDTLRKELLETKKDRDNARKQVDTLVDKYNDSLKQNETLQTKFDFLMELYEQARRERY